MLAGVTTCVFMHPQFNGLYLCVHLQGWVCGNVALSNDVKVGTGGLGQQGERRTTSAAGLPWLAWSSAGPAMHTQTHAESWFHHFRGHFMDLH